MLLFHSRAKKPLFTPSVVPRGRPTDREGAAQLHAHYKHPPAKRRRRPQKSFGFKPFQRALRRRRRRRCSLAAIKI